MTATLFNTTSHEKSRGFVYRWTYIPTGQYYIGIHRGTTDDNYIGSGKRFRRKWAVTDPNDWQREILYEGLYKKCPDIEKDLVSDKTLQDPLCLNLIQGGNNTWQPLLGWSRKSAARVKPQEVIVKGIKYNTRLQAIKELNISFQELDTLKEQESFNEYNRR